MRFGRCVREVWKWQVSRLSVFLDSEAVASDVDEGLSDCTRRSGKARHRFI